MAMVVVMVVMIMAEVVVTVTVVFFFSPTRDSNALCMQAASLIRRVQPMYDLVFFVLPRLTVCNVGEVQRSKGYKGF